MKRTQIQLDEEFYWLLKERAHTRDKSMAQVFRDALKEHMEASRNDSGEGKRFTFIGSGRSEQDTDQPVSEHHDDAFSTSIT